MTEQEIEQARNCPYDLQSSIGGARSEQRRAEDDHAATALTNQRNLATENLSLLHRARLAEDRLPARDREIVVLKELPLRRMRASTSQSEVI